MGPPEEEGAGRECPTRFPPVPWLQWHARTPRDFLPHAASHEDVEIEHSRKRRADSEGEDGAVPEKPEKRSRKEKSSKKDKKKKRKKKEKSKKKKRVVSDSDAEEVGCEGGQRSRGPGGAVWKQFRCRFGRRAGICVR